MGCCLLVGGCGGSSSSSSGMPPAGGGMARARFAEGAPALEAIINGVPQNIGNAYLQVDDQTLSSSFNYATLTQFVNLAPGVHTVQAVDVLGYKVGPLKSASLTAGKSYTLILVGSYPSYEILTFPEPAYSGSAALSLYEASPSVPHADFGTFTASRHADFKRLGTATLGGVVTVTLGKTVSGIGGYAGKGTQPFTGGTVTPAQIDSFDKHNALPFHNAARLSLLLFDVKEGSTLGPLVGSLDR